MLRRCLYIARTCKFFLQRPLGRCKTYNQQVVVVNLQRPFGRCKPTTTIWFTTTSKDLQPPLVLQQPHAGCKAQVYNQQTIVVKLQRANGRCKV